MLALAEPNILFPFTSPENYNKIFLVLFAVFIPAWFGDTRFHKWDNFVGELSYPMYVVHLVGIGLLVRFGVASEWLGLLGLVSAIAASLLMNYAVEQPIDRFRQSLLRRSRPALATARPIDNVRHRCDGGAWFGISQVKLTRHRRLPICGLNYASFAAARPAFPMRQKGAGCRG